MWRSIVVFVRLVYWDFLGCFLIELQELPDTHLENS